MTKQQDDFLTMFWCAIDSAITIYNQHRDEKDDSWQDMTAEELRALVCKEYFEFSATKDDTNEECHELIDLILVSLMLAEQLINKGRYV